MAGPEPSSEPEVVVRRSGTRWVVTVSPGAVGPASGSAPDGSAASGSGGPASGSGGPAPGSGEVVDDLVSALVLADLLSPDVDPGPRPARGTADPDETARLRTAVRQLEHALSARVVVEQAIGVLAERAGVDPRVAFEQMRRIARSQGRKVHDLAVIVVASVSDASTQLPKGLPRRRQ